MNLRAVNKKTFESMAMAGAFDSWGLYHRAQLMEVPEGENMSLLEKAVRYGNNYQAEQQAAQQSLFGGSAAVASPFAKDTGSSTLDTGRNAAPRERSGRLLYFRPPARSV